MESGGSPPPCDVRVSVENWQEPPQNRWSYWHVGQLLPTRRIACGTGSVRELPTAPASVPIEGVESIRQDGSVATVGEVLAETYTDAYVVLQAGELVAEWYGPQGAPNRTHALMSVSKSVVGCVAGALVDRELLDIERPVTDFVPELAASGYAGALVHDVLDMRSGVQFREDYTDPEADVNIREEWLSGALLREDPAATGLYAYLTGLQADAAHGQRFRYRTADADVLGWVCERAAGQSMADLIAELVWQPMGAEFDAEIICDTTGTPVHGGGLCATARDSARFGQMLLDGGSVPNRDGGAVAVVEPRWLRDAWATDADARSVFAASPAEAGMPGGWYRRQFWFRPGAHGDVLLCLGIHGQMIHICRRTHTVCVKFSTWPQPQNAGYLQDTLRAFDAVGGALTGRTTTAGRRGLPGVVAGVSRHGAADRRGDLGDA